MHKQVGNKSREMETPRKNKKEMLATKSMATERRSLMGSSVDSTLLRKESELAHRSTQVPLTEMQRGEKEKVQQNI